MNTTESITYDHAGNIIEQSVTTTPQLASSVEIATDRKGHPKPSVMVYHDDPQEAKRLACKLYREIIETLQVVV
jgi:hypothetical protein